MNKHQIYFSISGLHEEPGVINDLYKKLGDDLVGMAKTFNQETPVLVEIIPNILPYNGNVRVNAKYPDTQEYHKGMATHITAIAMRVQELLRLVKPNCENHLLVIPEYYPVGQNEISLHRVPE